MVDISSVQQWLHSSKLYPDEQALFLLGEVPPDLSLDAIQVPAINSDGQPVILAGHLLQLGEKEIGYQGKKAASIQTKPIVICSVTLWKQDYDDMKWQDIAKQPVRYVKQILHEHNLDHALGVPWGRTFKSGKQTCRPEDSSSLQFHVEVAKDSLQPLLKASGWNGIFITPKDSTGKPDNSWRIVWAPLPKETLMPKTRVHSWPQNTWSPHRSGSIQPGLVLAASGSGPADSNPTGSTFTSCAHFHMGQTKR